MRALVGFGAFFITLALAFLLGAAWPHTRIDYWTANGYLAEPATEAEFRDFEGNGSCLKIHARTVDATTIQVVCEL